MTADAVLACDWLTSWWRHVVNSVCSGATLRENWGHDGLTVLCWSRSLRSKCVTDLKFTSTGVTLLLWSPSSSPSSSFIGRWQRCSSRDSCLSSRHLFVCLDISSGWLRGTVVERRSVTGELSLSYARPAADGWPLMWLNRPLQSQPTRPTQPFIISRSING